jgi:hypothetical protein
VHEFQRSPDAERINASLKQHEAPQKTLLDQEPDPHSQGNDAPTAAGQAVDLVSDEIQAAPPNVTEHEAVRTVGMTSVSPAAATQNPPPTVTESNGTMTRSLDALSLSMVIAILALGLIKLLLRRTYAKRVLAFGAMRLAPPAEHMRPVQLSLPSRNFVDIDSSAASLLSVKKAIDTIEEAVAEMPFSRQLRRRS